MALNHHNLKIIDLCNKTIIVLIALIMLFLNACSPTKYLQQEEYLLDKYTIETDDKKVEDYSLDDYVRQKPNKKILYFPLYVAIYNTIDPVKQERREEKWRPKEAAKNRKRLAKGKEPKEYFKFSRWIRKIGEEPVVYNRLQTRKTSKQITNLLKSKGYFNAKTTDSTGYKGKKADVTYNVKAGIPYTIRNYNDSIEDPEVAKILKSYFENKSKIKEGEKIDVSYFDTERTKINELMLENGYYRFAKEYIFFQVDTFVGNHKADVTILVKSPSESNDYGEKTLKPHKKYYFKPVTIYPDHEPVAVLQNKKQETVTYDSVPGENGITFLIAKKNKYTQAVLTRGLTIEPDSLYRASTARKSFTYYSSLSNFKLINFDFKEEAGSPADSGKSYLIPHIKLTPLTPQSFTVELEGNVTNGRLGTGANLLYRHMNIFGGAEILDLKVMAELNNQERELDTETNKAFSDTEVGVNATIRFPNLVLPFSSKAFYLKFYPKTAFSLGYSYRYNSSYRRSIFSTSYGYDWRSSNTKIHRFNVIEFSSVGLTQIDSAYLSHLRKNGQFQEKYDHLILGSSYTFTYNSQKVSKRKDFHYISLRFEPAGNFLNLYNKATNAEKLGYGDYLRQIEKIDNPELSDQELDARVEELNEQNPGFYTLFDLPYAQYFKTELDFRYYQILNSKNEIVYRINPGIILPYGNSFYSPQERRFYLGGASSMRAWQARQLGPGSFNDSLNIYQYGDIKLEMNLEYRFNIIWMIDGALFADAGNIWSLSKDPDEDESKKLNLSELHKQIALGGGIGLRMDFSFFVFRFDFGLPLYDPAETEGWFDFKKISPKNDFTLNFGIGYPF